MATAPSLPGNLNFQMYVGATFDLTLTYLTGSTPSPVNLTGYTAAATIKSGQTTVLSLTTSNSRITLGGSAGTIALHVSATDTAALTAGNYEYDLLLTSGSGQVTALVSGQVTVRKGQTV